MEKKKIFGVLISLALGCGIGAAACLIPANWDKIGGNQQEQPAKPGPQEPETNPNKPSNPTDVEIPYSIENGLITNYTGEETEITLPETYSYDSGFRIYQNASDFEKELKSFYPQDVDEPKSPFPLAIYDEFGFEQTINSFEEIQNLKYFPISTTIMQPRYLEGNDFKVKGIKSIYSSSSTARNSQITTISIPDSYTTISENAFQNMQNLETVNWPKSITEIPNRCFYYCRKLKSFDFTTLTSIGAYAFQSTALTSINLPSTLEKLGSGSFSGCSSLQKVNFEPGIKITAIPNECFKDSGCESINLPEGIQSIGDASFRSCSALTDVNLPTSLNKIGNLAFFNCKTLTELVLPEGVTEISNVSFDVSSQFVKLTIKNSTSVITIKENTQVGWAAVCKVVVPDNLYDAYMADPNWNVCTIVKASEKPEAKEIPFTIENGLITGYTGQPVGGNITFPTSCSYDSSSGKYVEGDDIQITGIKNFDGDQNPYINFVFEITIPESYTTISERAFFNMQRLKTVNWPKSITKIPNECFKMCRMLKNFDFTGITSIGKYAFASTAFTSITLPSTLEELGEGSFSGCGSIENIIFEPGIKITAIPNGCFNGLRCEIDLPEGIQSIGDSAFVYAGFSNINLPTSLKKMGVNVFGDCKTLTELVLPEGVIEISYQTFRDSSIEKLTIKNSSSVITITEGSNQVVLKEGCQVIVPDNLYDAYRADSNWNSYTIVKASEATQ